MSVLTHLSPLLVRSFMQPLVKCRLVFQSLNTIAISELVQTADSLLAPVRLGVCRPAQPFSMVSSTIEATQASEELFSVEPLPLRPSTPSSVEEAPTQERHHSHRRSQRHRRRQAHIAPQGQGRAPATGAEGEEVEVRNV